jgi:hypothetical protein
MEAATKPNAFAVIQPIDCSESVDPLSAAVMTPLTMARMMSPRMPRASDAADPSTGP